MHHPVPGGRPDPHQDPLGVILCVHDLDIKEAVVVEDPAVEELILLVVSAPPGVLLDQVGVGKGTLRVEIPGPKECRRRDGVFVEVELFDVLAVIALRVGQTEESLFEDRIALVPSPMLAPRDTGPSASTASPPAPQLSRRLVPATTGLVAVRFPGAHGIHTAKPSATRAATLG